MKNIIRKLLKQNLMELRDSLLNYLKKKLPNVPSYILQDFFYATLKTASKEQIGEFIEYYGKFTWKLEENFPINDEMLSVRTKHSLHIRSGGDKNPYEVPNDKERHATQKDLLSKRGFPTEPIIMIYEDGKYDLTEGWHRVIQLFNTYPEGFKYPNVYVGYAPQ